MFLAQEVATVDVLSEGRVEFGLGAGWMEADYARSGTVMDSAGRRIDRTGSVHRPAAGGG